MTTHGVDYDAITCATASPPPLAAELGFTRVRPPISWPKSDKSDFGWRDREGARNKTRQAHPPPQPPPPTGGGAQPARGKGAHPGRGKPRETPEDTWHNECSLPTKKAP